MTHRRARRSRAARDTKGSRRLFELLRSYSDLLAGEFCNLGCAGTRFFGLGSGRQLSGGIGRDPDTFVLLEIPTVSGLRDSIQATSIAAMSGQFDFRSARQNSGRDRTISLPVID